MRLRNNTSVHSVATGSRIRMRLSVTKTVYTLGDIAGLVRHFLHWVLIELFMRVPIGLVKPTPVAIVVKSLDAVVELHERGIPLSATGIYD